ncbi:MAG: 2-oxo acid dehydrogenase subunit E2 [Treponema sp.]|jgi:pyruvate dehydrogenase E2 component (dihydrolipoamide acetyltransferase)|nr:2-oxo acid dehydrogenase subunit E2 [Treponema sp.]
MAHVLIMPRQGNTVESCIIQEWKVREGDAVTADTTLCVVETDKATFEVPAGADGQVLKILSSGGDDVPVLQPIAVIGAAGEDWRAAVPAGDTPAAKAGGAAASDTAALAAPDTAEAAGTGAPVAAAPMTAGSPASAGAGVSPRARNLAVREGLDPAEIAGSGPGGRVIERDVRTALAGRPPLTAAARSATARSAPAASPAGAADTAGTGIGGRITVSDLDRSRGSAAGVFPGRPEGSGEEKVTETPVKGVRKLIADRMLASLTESAQFTLNAGAPAARLQELRKRFKAGENPAPGGLDLGLGRITVNDLILYAVSRVLPAYPYMNAHKTGDTLKTYERIHLGMAVDTPRGLMVPVIRNADLLSLRRISLEAKRLAAACQDGSVKPGELSGSTFTVSNLGSFGITGFTPVLNAPEVAILGVCGIELKPAEETGGGFAFVPHIGFSLTINHQVVDGAPAARFLSALCGAVADIDLLLAAN